ncbi:hypothetical protein [Streptomyces sp. NPDC058872]|uniref:hypothetical protein n=1 Tax=Streptomyces sp. NPDC058872 TaxID=3346661 RepID=UPI003674D9CB
MDSLRRQSRWPDGAVLLRSTALTVMFVDVEGEHVHDRSRQKAARLPVDADERDPVHRPAASLPLVGPGGTKGPEQ